MGNPSAPGGFLSDLGVSQDFGEAMTGEWLSKDVHQDIDDVVFDERGQRADAARAEAAAAEKQRGDMEGYWETYQTWAADAETSLQRSTGSMKARMSAGDVKRGTEQWDTNIAKIQSEYDTEMAGYRTGVTGAAMSGWAETQQKESGGTLSMEDFMSQEFGMKEFASDRAMTDKSRATAASKRAAAGTQQREAATTTSSPWW